LLLEDIGNIHIRGNMLNVLIIGIGQCGNRILDSINKEAFGGSSLAKYYGTQKFKSHVETLAINMAVNDLKEMKHTKAKDRIPGTAPAWGWS